MPSLKQGLLAELQEYLLNFRGTVSKWEDYLSRSCRLLESKRLFAVLYKMQLLMKVCDCLNIPMLVFVIYFICP